MRIDNIDVTNRKTKDRPTHLESHLRIDNKENHLQFDHPLSSNTFDVTPDNVVHLQNYMSQLQNIISNLANEQQNIKLEWKTHIQNLKRAIKEINAQIGKIQTRYEEISDGHQKVIQQQSRALKTNLMIKLARKLRRAFQPKIGCLYQYAGSRPLIIPNHYTKQFAPFNPPTISIVTPSFNQGVFIERTIRSVIEQQYPELEYIIQDGGSTDETVEVIEHHASAIKSWESRPDGGQSQAINLGFERSSGEIMAYLNSDDILLPGTLNYIANYFVTHPDVDVVYGHRIVIDEYDNEVGRWVLPTHDEEVLSWVDYIPQETLFWRRSIWDKVGGKIDEKFKFAMDWDLILRFREAGAKFVRLPRFLGGFRVHSLQKTSALINQIGMKEMQNLRKRCHGRYVADSEIKAHVRKYQIKHLVLHHLFRLGFMQY